jgi:hypothetical protein
LSLGCTAALIVFLKPTNYPPWLEELKNGPLQKKGVRQFKKFHLEDEGNLHQQDVLHDEPILPKQVMKGVLEILMFHQMIKVLIHKPILMLLQIWLNLD